MKTQIIKYLPWALLVIVISINHNNIKRSRELEKELDTSLETCHYELKQCKFMCKGE